jgi:DNA processing protein
MSNSLPDIAYLLGFTLIAEIGPARFEKITKNCKTFQAAWEIPKTTLLKKGVDQKTIDVFCQKKNVIDLEKEYEKFKNSEYQLITKNSSEYPQQLREVKNAPYVLFCLGNVQLLSKKQIAIVGTRLPTEYGKIATTKICQGLANSGLVITSGMANGIDTIAHQTALEANCPTIAVLGEGFDQAQTKFHVKKTIEKIVSSEGLVVSEYHPCFRATRFTFPARNRIISGLSLGTLVVEAGEKSGSLITANCALEQNREVFAIPGNIFSSQSIGTNLLIKQGAQLVSSHNDVLICLQFIPSNSQSRPAPNFENETEKKIYTKLSLEPIHLDALAKKCDLPQTEIASTISMMELRGIVKNIGGGMFIKQ